MLSLEEIKGDGGNLPCTDEDLAQIKSEAREIDSVMHQDIWGKRLWTEDTRYARWGGQSPDGRKREAFMGSAPLPFEGAMDAKIFTADDIINDRVAEYLVASLWMNIRCSGVESGDAAAAGKIKTLLQWIIRNQWGNEWVRNIELLAQYQEGDSPGCAIAMVDWVRERALEMREITPEDLAGIIAEMTQTELTPDVQAAIVDMALNPEREDELTQILQGIFPNMKAGRVAKVVKALHTEGKAEFPAPYTRVNLPVFKALRYFDDIFLPINTLDDLQSARRIYRRQWFSRAMILEQAATNGWNKDFVTDVVGDGTDTKGAEIRSMFYDYNRYMVTRSTPIANYNPRQGLYEIVTVYEKLVNEDGIPGIYTTKVHCASEHTAKGRELFNRRHGKYPFVWFSTESITNNLADARGVTEQCVTFQNEKKLYRDSYSDHVQVTVNPPLLKPAGKARYDLLRVLFGEIDRGPRENFDYLKGPDYPKAADTMMAAVDKDVAWHFGLEHPDIDPARAVKLRQKRVSRFLGSLGEVLYMTVELFQQFATPEDLQRIVGGAGMPVPKTIKEIQGRFDVVPYIDVRDWDLEFLKLKGDMLLTYVKRLDAHNTVNNDPIAANLLAAMDPNLAELAVRPADSANAAEAEAATQAFVKILNGVRPEMTEGGMNAQLRLDTLKNLWAQRAAAPAAYPPLAPASQALLQEYVDYLTFQVKQFEENPQTGRLGVDTTKTDAEIQQSGGGQASASVVSGQLPVGGKPGAQ